jgi:tripartite-type tricarboxylate transporter receptor subunit TctC
MKPICKSRRLAIAATAVALTLSLAATAQETFPTKPIKLVVPYAPGAITDTAARLVAERMSAVLGQQVVIENRGGAGTRIGVQHVASATPDGYTLLYVNSITHGSMPAMSRTLPFDPVKSFTPVAPLFWYANVFVCHPSVPANTIQELVAYAKQNPGKLTNATAGPGSGHDFLGSLFNTMTGVNILHVHYKGGGPALQDVLAGHVNCIYGDGNARQMVETGKLKAFATAGPARDPLFPNVPTMNEAGVLDFSLPINHGIAAPTGTPSAIVNRLNAAANEALKHPQLQQKARELGLTINAGAPTKLAQVIAQDLARFSKIASDASIPKE